MNTPKRPGFGFVSKLTVAAICLGAMCGLAMAQTPAAGAAAKKVPEGPMWRLSVVAEQVLGSPVDSIGPSPIEGLFEVVVKDRIYYIDKSGKYLVDGHVVDVATRSSLTAKRKLEIADADRVEFNPRDLKFADAIRTTQGKPTPGRVLVTFEDPRCKFCKKLHADLAGIKDVVIYTFQVSFLGAESRSLNEAVFCSADKAKAWAQVIADGPRPAAAAGKCDLSALDRNTALARKLRVTGTPTMFLADGQKVVGAIGTEALEKAISNASKRK